MAPEPGERRILKVAYNEPLKRSPVTLWSLTTLELSLPAARHARSFHLQLDVPDGLEIESVKVEGGKAETRTTRRRTHFVEDHTKARRATFSVRAERQGFLSSALLLSAVTFGLLAAALVDLGATIEDVQAAGPVLLIIPALLTAFLVRPAEHALTGVVLTPSRWALTGSGVTAVGAAAVLVVADPSGPRPTVLWIVLVVLAGVAAAIPLMTWYLASEREEGSNTPAITAG
jgi:hypothetical protein